MAVPANFGSQQYENIREQFTAGVLSTTIREPLLLDHTLPFEQVVKIVLNIERLKAEAKEITVTTKKQLTCNVTHAAHIIDCRPSRGASSSRQLAG
ncbi:hypothetical protein HPB47_010419 [Ixodes persulcatus]|uniref:Uncharacterized protein n=1 Tax=Ixodes persulcatus TaxID=34615 RepID=A0AC60NZ60_IXOPE|nr:hypothetical protein HPB47_010419 [Ixodes persulcatus]